MLNVVLFFLQDLESLCEGLEGRSNNPVALLFDHLFHPDADLGLDNPSVLDWKFEEQLEIPHVVLGKSKTGGTWQVRVNYWYQLNVFVHSKDTLSIHCPYVLLIYSGVPNNHTGMFIYFGQKCRRVLLLF